MMNRGCVKSIQRLSKTINSDYSISIDADINPVNIDKTIIINDPPIIGEAIFNGYVTFNSNTSIKISLFTYDNGTLGSYHTTVTFHIQIVEYY